MADFRNDNLHSACGGLWREEKKEVLALRVLEIITF